MKKIELEVVKRLVTAQLQLDDKIVFNINWAVGFEKGLKICFSLAANYTSWVYEW